MSTDQLEKEELGLFRSAAQAPLGDVTGAPAPDSDRFGTFNPGNHP